MGIQTASQAISNESGGNSPFGFKNRIINGAMNIWQRGTTASNVTTGSNFYLADRFGANRNSDATGMNVDRMADAPTGFTYSLRLQRASGNALSGGMYLYYTFESKDILDLKGKQVTLSFWAKTGANYTGGAGNIILSYGTGTDERVYQQTGAAYATNSTFTPTTTWTKFTFTGTLGSNMGDLGFFVYTTSHSGTAGADDSLYLTGFQLEAGTQATSFDYRPYGLELRLCQRYFEKCNLRPVNVIDSTSLTRFSLHNAFLVEKRTDPTTVVTLLKQYNGSTLTVSTNPFFKSDAAYNGYGTASTSLSQTVMQTATATFDAEL